MNELLLANLRALHGRDPVLVTRISWPVADAHVVDVQGEICLVYRGAPRPLRDPRTPLPAAAASDRSEPLRFFGLGLGEAVVAALQGDPGLRVRVWERDPWLLRLFLARHDVREALASGRLTLLLGCDLVDELPAAREAEDLAQARAAPLSPEGSGSDGGGPDGGGPEGVGCISPAARLGWIPHPTLQSVYRREWRMLSTPRAATALVCEGGLFVDDLADNLEREDYAVYCLDTQVLSLEEMAYTCQRLAPRLIAAINYKNGFAEFARSQGVPLLSWEIDPTTDHLPKVEGDDGACYFFTYRRAQVEGLVRNGFTRAEYLPLASEPERRYPITLGTDDHARYACDVSFVGSSMIAQAADWKRRLVDALATPRAEVAAADAAAAEAAAARALAEERLERLWQAQAQEYARYRVPELVRELIPELWALAQSARAGGDLVQWVAEVAAARKRLAYVQGLAPFQPHVWGDEGWRQEGPDSGVRYRGRAGHGDELTRIYCASTINIDVNRLYQMDIVPMRIFDVLACGGFLLAEAGSALEELFVVGEEIAVYRDLDDLRAQVARYLADPAARAAIAARGRARVLRDHTLQARIQTMLRRAQLPLAADPTRAPSR